MKKIIWIAVLVLFVISLIVISILVKNKTNDVLYSQTESNQINTKEEVKEIIKVTNENFEEEVLESDKPVLIDFYADWCDPCKILSPIVEEVAKEYDSIKVVKINVDEEQQLAEKYQIIYMPTLVCIKNGEEYNRAVGILNKNKILSIINL